MQLLALPKLRARYPDATRQILRFYATTHIPTTNHERVDFAAIDAKWRSRWEAAKAPNELDSKRRKKAFVMPMFPYPSGTLHLGHLRVYTISDVIARFKSMQGLEVIHPIGWDAFGLPAENAANERGVDPADWTHQNIAKMKEQLQAMGGKLDWSREISTCDPSFYKHTQKIFLMLHERGLAYQAKSFVNFDPVDRTVLANEQVDANGCSWRSRAKVQRLELKQWFLRIKAFQKELLEDVDQLSVNDHWPERVTTQQRNWIGRSTGAKVAFAIESELSENKTSVEVFTTRLDTLFGVQYLALSLHHPLVRAEAAQRPELQEFIEAARNFPPESKAGMQLRSVRAFNPAAIFKGPLRSDIARPLPVFVAPYVVEDYGSGAVMGVPGHDTRDFAFWKENRPGEPILRVVGATQDEALASPYILPESSESCFTPRGILSFASGSFGGMKSDEAMVEICNALSQSLTKDTAQLTENWRLRDWLISRQRYWGCPIPIVYCDTCGTVPVPDTELPVKLPKLKADQLGKGGNPLEHIPEWLNTQCPRCHGHARRETDTMDTFMDSSWYFFRYLDPQNETSPVSPELADAHLPVDIYVGGVEHAILHLLYARFISKFLATTPLWPSGGGKGNNGEPFKRLISQGMVHGKTFTDPATGRFLRPDEVDTCDPTKPLIKATGLAPNVSFEKMSKSKYNGVDPASCISQYGADATRAHMLFAAPVTEVLEWHEDRIVGIQRWFNRLWRVASHPEAGIEQDVEASIVLDSLNNAEADLWLLTQQTIASATEALSKTFTLNTLVSDLIKLTNALANDLDTGSVSKKRSNISSALRYASTSALLRMLAPVAPAFSEECWEKLHSPSPVPSIFASSYPVVDTEAINKLSSRSQLCAVQINGKLRFTLNVPVPSDNLIGKSNESKLRDWILPIILKSEDGQRYFGANGKLSLDADVRKVIVVKGGKTVNFVVSGSR